jgi:hypothetical protein
MNRIKLAVLSLLALAFARPVGFSTANTKAAEKEQPLADKVEDAVLGKPIVDDRPPQEQIADLRAELAAVRAAVPVPVAAIAPLVTGTTALLIAGAEVDPADVGWRIRAGLSPAQAVEVALQEKNEAAANKKGAKK